MDPDVERHVRSGRDLLSGVEAVNVTLVADGTSTVTVTSSAELSDDAVAAAVEEAGYAVVTP